MCRETEGGGEWEGGRGEGVSGREGGVEGGGQVYREEERER